MILKTVYTIAKTSVIMNKIDGTKANVLGATTTLLIGKPSEEMSYFGRTNLPATVKPTPSTTWRMPRSQNQGPKNVHGFFEKNVLNNVKASKNNQMPAKTNKPMINPNET